MAEIELFFMPDAQDDSWIVAKTAEGARVIATQDPLDDSLEGEAWKAAVKEWHRIKDAAGPWVSLCAGEVEQMLGLALPAARSAVDPIRVTVQIHL